MKACSITFFVPTAELLYRGRPAVSAPMQNECVVIGARLVDGTTKLRIVVNLRLVRIVPSKYVNNDPVLLRWCANKFFNHDWTRVNSWGKANNTAIPKGVCF